MRPFPRFCAPICAPRENWPRGTARAQILTYGHVWSIEVKYCRKSLHCKVFLESAYGLLWPPWSRGSSFTRERSKVRSLVRPPERSIKSDTFSKAPSGVHFPVHSVCGWSHDVAQNRSGSNSKKPNRNDGTKHGQAGNRPARHVNRTVGLRCVHHRVMPMGHISLLKASSSEACPRT